jgi:hypothetical protein
MYSSKAIFPLIHPLIFQSTALGASLPQTVGGIVNTTSGNVVGHASSWKPAISEYLGIPFAQPPINNLRFAAPLPYLGNGKQITASKYVSPDDYDSQL